MQRGFWAGLLLVTAVCAGGAFAAQSFTNATPAHGAAGHQGSGMTQIQAPGADTKSPAPTEATMAFRAAATQMHKDMAIRYGGDPDRDFAAAMIAHHQGAIALAQVELRFGTVPDMRALAQAVIETREREIREMQAWLGKQP